MHKVTSLQTISPSKNKKCEQATGKMCTKYKIVYTTVHINSDFFTVTVRKEGNSCPITETDHSYSPFSHSSSTISSHGFLPSVKQCS